MQKTIISTPGNAKYGVRLDYSRKNRQLIIRSWSPKGIGAVHFTYRKAEYPDTLIINNAIIIDWQFSRDI